MIFERVAYFSKEECRTLLEGLIPLSMLRYYNHTHYSMGFKFQEILGKSLPLKRESLVDLREVYNSLLKSAKDTDSLSLWGSIIKKAIVLVDTTLNLFNT